MKQQFNEAAMQMLSTKYQRYFKNCNIEQSSPKPSKIKFFNRNTPANKFSPSWNSHQHQVYPIKINKSLPEIALKNQKNGHIFNATQQKFYQSFAIDRNAAYRSHSNRSAHENQQNSHYRTVRNFKNRLQKKKNIQQHHKNSSTQFTSLKFDQNAFLKDRSVMNFLREEENLLESHSLRYRRSKNTKSQEKVEEKKGERVEQNQRRKFFQAFIRRKMLFNQGLAKFDLKPNIKAKINQKIIGNNSKELKQERIQPWDI